MFSLYSKNFFIYKLTSNVHTKSKAVIPYIGAEQNDL